MARMNLQAFNSVLEKLQTQYNVYGPVTQNNKGAFSNTDLVTYGPINTFEDMNLDSKSFFSPKELFYPVRETLFHFAGGQTLVPDLDEKDLVIFARPCDINGVERLDQIFLHNGAIADFYYARRRNKVHFFMIECVEGFDSCFCVDMNSHITHQWAAAFRFGKDAIDYGVKDPNFESFFADSCGDYLVNSCHDNAATDFEPLFIQQNATRVTLPAVDSIKPEHFENPVWTEYTERCIACGRCNTSCITCSCFTMQDVSHDSTAQSGERRRRWASCHVNGYTEMAGGHSFRKRNGERMRFKTLHKINDYHKRFGHHMCVGCGRCDDVCPEYISFSKCINKLNEVIQAQGGAK